MLITKKLTKRNTSLERWYLRFHRKLFLRKWFSSNSAKQFASAALQAVKTPAKDIGMKSIDVGKTVAIDAGKKLDENAAKKLSISKSQAANVMVPPEEVSIQLNEVIAKYVNTSAIDLNKRIDGSSVNRPNASNAIAIQDLVKRPNGSGFLLLLKMMAYILLFTDTSIIDESIEEHEYYD